jgi:hypothetical protein
MSTAQETPSGHQVSRSQRVLACVLCQQRKVKCDRKFPCANCIKSRAQCVPATLLPRRPRRKVPERDLVDRLRRYEDLLRHNNIKFEPDDDATSENDRPSNAVSHEHGNSEEADEPSPATTTKSSGSSRVKYVGSGQSMNPRLTCSGTSGMLCGNGYVILHQSSIECS